MKTRWKHKTRSQLATAALVLVLCHPLLVAQPNTGYTLTGTIARPDAAPALASADGRYSMSGGVYPDHTPRRCPADFAEPAGLLDLADIVAWVGAFETGDPFADYAAPYGLFDLADILGFVEAFTTGCD